MYSLLRLRIAEYYEEVRRALDLDVETLILKRQDKQSLIDELNQRRDSQIEFLKQEEDDALKRANQVSITCNDEQEVIKWCYFTIHVGPNKICLIRSDVLLSPEQIATYRQFLTKATGFSQVPQLLETFDVKFHHLVMYHERFEDYTRFCGDRTVITLDSSSPPLFLIGRLTVVVTLCKSVKYRLIEDFIDSPSARFILKHVRRVEYDITLGNQIPPRIPDQFHNALSTLIQLDKIFHTFRQSVSYVDKQTAPTIFLHIAYASDLNYVRRYYERLLTIDSDSLPGYKYQAVSTFGYVSTEKDLDLLNYMYGRMEHLQILSVLVRTHSDLLKPLICLPGSSHPGTNIYLSIICAPIRRQKVTRRIDIQNTLSTIKDSIKDLEVTNIYKDVNLEIVNTKSLLDLVRVDKIQLVSFNDIKTDYLGGGQLSVMTLEHLKNMVSYFKGGSASVKSSEYENRFILNIDPRIVSDCIFQW